MSMLTLESLKIDPAQVRGPQDLPPALWLGIREDTSFARTDGGFVCPYVYADRVVQLLRYEAGGDGADQGAWQFADTFGAPGERQSFVTGERVPLFRLSAGASLLEALQSHAQEVWEVEDPRERWMAEEIAALGGLEYVPEPPESLAAELVPDGKVKCLVLPLTEARLTALRERAAALEERFHARVLLESCPRLVIALGGAEQAPEARAGMQAAAEASLGVPVQESRSTLFDGAEVLLMLQPVPLARIVVVWRDVLPLVRDLAGEGLLPPPGAGVLTRGQVTDVSRAIRSDFFVPAGAADRPPSPGEFVVIYPMVDVGRLRPEDLGEGE